MNKKFYLVLFIIFILSLIGLGSWGLTESSEARYAQISKEMMQSGDYLHPTLLGIKHFHKPPITYYITSIGYQIFGVNEFGARFFLSVALILQLFLVYKISLQLFNKEKIAIAASFIYLSFPIVLISIRNLTTDAYLITFILLSLYLWLYRRKGGSLIYLYAFYLALGIAFLTKGPVALIPIGFFIAIWKIVKKEGLQLTLHTILGSILFLVISGSWFFALIIDDPNLWTYFIEEQIVNRSVAAEKFHRSKPFWYYLLLAPIIGLPWMIFIGIEIFKKSRSIINSLKPVKILGISIASLFILFSIFSSKLILYILPIFPFLAILGGYIIFQIPLHRIKIYEKIYVGLISILFLGLLFLLISDQFNIQILSAGLLLMGVVITLLIVFKMIRKAQLKLLSLGVVFSLCLLLMYATFGSKNSSYINSPIEIADFIKTINRYNSTVIVYNDLLPALSFYLEKDIITIYKSKYRAKREIKFENDSSYKKNYLNLDKVEDIIRFRSMVHEAKNIFLIKTRKVNDSISGLLSEYSDVKNIGKWSVYY
jgi:4-amino-4-deoxy-L-arabinose transferase-like glycosyltransferase